MGFWQSRSLVAGVPAAAAASASSSSLAGLATLDDADTTSDHLTDDSTADA
jgi:hypothetical protein